MAKKKSTCKKKIKDIATDLVKIAATRQLMKAEVVESNSLEYEKFSSKFEFTETSDQIKDYRRRKIRFMFRKTNG